MKLNRIICNILNFFGLLQYNTSLNGLKFPKTWYKNVLYKRNPRYIRFKSKHVNVIFLQQIQRYLLILSCIIFLRNILFDFIRTDFFDTIFVSFFRFRKEKQIIVRLLKHSQIFRIFPIFDKLLFKNYMTFSENYQVELKFISRNLSFSQINFYLKQRKIMNKMWLSIDSMLYQTKNDLKFQIFCIF